MPRKTARPGSSAPHRPLAHPAWSRKRTLGKELEPWAKRAAYQCLGRIRGGFRTTRRYRSVTIAEPDHGHGLAEALIGTRVAERPSSTNPGTVVELRHSERPLRNTRTKS
jgi:hypothetical protein